MATATRPALCDTAVSLTIGRHLHGDDRLGADAFEDAFFDAASRLSDRLGVAVEAVQARFVKPGDVAPWAAALDLEQELADCLQEGRGGDPAWVWVAAKVDALAVRIKAEYSN